MLRFCIALLAVVLIALIPTIFDPQDGRHPRWLSMVRVPVAILYSSAPRTATVVGVAAAHPERPIGEAREAVPWTVERVR